MKTKQVRKDNLNERIQEELGINLAEYRNEEIASSLVELLVFPTYIVNWVIRPVIIAFVLFILGYFFIDLVHIEYIIYTILGFLLFIITGLTVGLWLLSVQMKQDIGDILNFALDTMSNVLNDVKNIQNSMTINKNSEVMGLLFSGIIQVTIIPVLSSVISKKMKFGGFIIEGFVSKVLNIVASKMKFDEVELKESESLTEKNSYKRPEHQDNKSFPAIKSSQKGINTILNIAFNIGQFPIKIAAVLSLLGTIIFLYFIW